MALWPTKRLDPAHSSSRNQQHAPTIAAWSYCLPHWFYSPWCNRGSISDVLWVSSTHGPMPAFVPHPLPPHLWPIAEQGEEGSPGSPSLSPEMPASKPEALLRDHVVHLEWPTCTSHQASARGHDPHPVNTSLGSIPRILLPIFFYLNPLQHLLRTYGPWWGWVTSPCCIMSEIWNLNSSACKLQYTCLVPPKLLRPNASSHSSKKYLKLQLNILNATVVSNCSF